MKNNAHLSRGKSLEAYDGDFIIWADFVIISRVSKGKGKQALFLQVCFCSETVPIRSWDIHSKGFSVF